MRTFDKATNLMRTETPGPRHMPIALAWRWITWPWRAWRRHRNGWTDRVVKVAEEVARRHFLGRAGAIEVRSAGYGKARVVARHGDQRASFIWTPGGRWRETDTVGVCWPPHAGACTQRQGPCSQHLSHLDEDLQAACDRADMLRRLDRMTTDELVRTAAQLGPRAAEAARRLHDLDPDEYAWAGMLAQSIAIRAEQ